MGLGMLKYAELKQILEIIGYEVAFKKRGDS